MISFYGLHLCIGLAVVMIPFALASGESIVRIPDLVHCGYDRFYFIYYCTLVYFFYFNYYYFVPKVYFPKPLHYFLLILFFLTCFGILAEIFRSPELIICDEQSHIHLPDPTRIQFIAPLFVAGISATLLFVLAKRKCGNGNDEHPAKLT